MISGIRLKSFKAFEELDLTVAPVTVILGPNNSGKSSILAPLRALVQTLESFDSQIPLLLSGIMGDFGTFNDVVYSGHGRKRRLMQIGVSVHTPSRQRILDESSVWDSELLGDRTDLTLEYRYRPQRREIVLGGTEIQLNGRLLISTKYSEDTERQIVEKIGDSAVPSELKGAFSRLLRYNNFLPWYGFIPRRDRGSEGSALDRFLDGRIEESMSEVRTASRRINSVIRGIEYVGAMRMPPERTYTFSGERRQRVGPAGEYAANLLTMDYYRAGSRSREITTKVEAWMKRAGIGSQIRPEPIADRYYELRIKHPITGEQQNIADVGQGNSQVLPVLVGGYNLSKGSIYLVEEPEIHLHPRAQAELGDFLYDLYRNRVQVLVETHSEPLILRLQQHIARGSIPPQHIVFHYVYADPHTSAKTVKTMIADPDGLFTDTWPEGFFSEPLEEAEKLTLIRFRKQAGRS